MYLLLNPTTQTRRSLKRVTNFHEKMKKFYFGVNNKSKIELYRPPKRDLTSE